MTTPQRRRLLWLCIASLISAAPCVVAAVPGASSVADVSSAPDVSSTPGVPSVAETVRVSATLNGVFSPRGFFNILVPLGDYEDVKAVKLDLKPAHITIDFVPGSIVTQEEMRRVMSDAGYTPGTITISRLPVSKTVETGPGWMEIRHPRSRHPLVRWFERNF